MIEEISIGFWWIWFCIFFSGYPIVYAIAHLLLKNKKWSNFIKTKVYTLLPLTYVLVITCFWIIILYESNFSFISKKVAHSSLAQMIIEWNLLGLLFWIPILRKKNYICFIHSGLFFILPLIFVGNNIIRYGVLEREDIFNVLYIYTASAFIYAVVITILLLSKFLFLHLASTKHQHNLY